MHTNISILIQSLKHNIKKKVVRITAQSKQNQLKKLKPLLNLRLYPVAITKHDGQADGKLHGNKTPFLMSTLTYHFYFQTRVSMALNRPLQNRCAELTVLLERATISELHTVFPILIDSIFGPQGSYSWGLRSTTADTNSLDFQTLHHFLSPLGPLFRAIYLLLRDPHVAYEFNVRFLPVGFSSLGFYLEMWRVIFFC